MLSVFSKLRNFLVGQELIESERRQAVRIPCKMKASLEGISQPVMVVNLSLLGLRVESPGRLRKNTVLRLEGRECSGKAVGARVIWCTSQGGKFGAGLSLIGNPEENRDSWTTVALNKLTTGHKSRERRAHVRVAIKGVATLTQFSGAKLTDGHLRNIGLGGALFVSEVGVQPGNHVCLQLKTRGRPPLNEPATVRSCRKDARGTDFFVGLQFTTAGSEAVRQFLRSL